MKKTVTLTIEVDMDCEASKDWTRKSDFFENEVDEVIDTLTSLSRRHVSKLSKEEGETENGSKFKVLVKKVK